MNPCFAIIDRNTLSSKALREMLQEVFDRVEVHSYQSVSSFIRDSNRHFVHFFVNADILFEYVDEFETLKKQTTVLIAGPDSKFGSVGFRTLDMSLPEEKLVEEILSLRENWNNAGPEPRKMQVRKIKDLLSAREKEVLTLMIKGFINKEIARTLDISVTTVIFHRNNICEKLGTRSLGKLAIYAVLSGITDINEV